MSIMALKHIVLAGLSADKDATIRDVQAMGCMELIPLVKTAPTPGTPRRPQALEALAFLLSCPRRRQQVTHARGFDAQAIETQALQLARRIQDREDERDALVQRIRDLRPWGRFTFPELQELEGYRLWFYAVPPKLMDQVRSSGLVWWLAHCDDTGCYVVVVSPDEPNGMPVPRTHAGNRSPEVLERRLEEVTQEIDDLQDQRSSLTRWCLLFAKNIGELEDRDARVHARTLLLDSDPVFALAAWAPAGQVDAVKEYARAHGLLCETRDPADDERPPTLLHNPPAFDAGEALVTFYMTPDYRNWDPAPVVLFSFAVFFAMILADAGYAAVVCMITGLLWKRMSHTEGSRRFRRLLVLLSVFSLVFGVLVGSYFGVVPAAGTWLKRVAVVDMTDINAMMGLSIVIGVVHIVLANIMNAKRLGWTAAALAPFGWALMILGGFMLAGGGMLEKTVLEYSGAVMLAAGAIAVFAFSGAGKKPLARIVSGLLAFTKISGAFGDVLSYLRLFALGLASASLATAFNGMAGQARNVCPNSGLLLAMLVLLIGHVLNFVLSLSSAVIHGLRLNLIEFFNWSLTDEGKLFRPFKRKEGVSWSH